ncbi:MAG TPA: UDP-N-acetylmuramate dehydrogenase [Bacteroidota bacterium]|nr:UDP-N-acetylmuramate dehydrogenase [Bacteroidota bacterium]
MIDREDIQKEFRGKIALAEPMKYHTSFRIGGPADYYLEPADRDDCIVIVSFCRSRKLPFLMTGKGSNMLVSDEGIRGAVINLEYGMHTLRSDGDLIISDAGVPLARFVDFCIQQGCSGVEMLPGIPGTLGGAIVMNAGAYGGEISDYLVDVDILKGEEVITVSKKDAGFSYRRSNFQGEVVLGARFRLPRGDKAELLRNRRELLIRRNRAQPVNLPNSGSMFKNPPGTYAGKLIEEAGMKGHRIGNAQVSDRHANFVVNLGSASAADVLALIEETQKIVFERTGIHLELEIKLVGFAESVLQEVFI